MLCCFASMGLYAQLSAKVVQVGRKDITLGEILAVLQQKEKLSVMYDDNIPKHQSIHLPATTASLQELLQQVAAQTGLETKIINNSIYIRGTAVEKSSQLLQVSGTVSSADNQEFLPGVSIVTGSKKPLGVTDANGKFRFSVPPGTQVVFSFVGYQQVKQVINKSDDQLDIHLTPDRRMLDQVVVTALGLTQEKKSLGYAVQELKGDQMNEARDNNFINSLSGKIAGVNIISSGAVGSSARITIRGESSLNYQKNQPLMIVDGIPVGNDPVQNTTEADFGNSAGEFNPADIESVTVLKGPAASALYGSRAANGAIVITTKSGKGRRGLGVSVTSGLTWETPLILPKFQNDFGRGNGNDYVGSNFGYSNNGLYPNGVNDGTDESWGPRLDGSLRGQFNSPTTNGYRGGDVYLPNRGDIIPSPWIPHPNSARDFFETGHTRFNAVAFSGANDVANFRFSYTNQDEKGIVPNNDLTRNSFKLNAGYKLSSRLLAETSVNYTKSKSTNRPDLGYGRNKPMYFLLWMTRDVDMNSLRNYWQPGLEGIQQFQHNYEEDHNNPFFYQYENTTGQDKNQLYGNVKLTYNILDNLSLMVRGGTDYYNDFRPKRMAVSTIDNRKGFYEETTLGYQENNFDFLLSYKNKVAAFNYSLSLGGNAMERTRTRRTSTVEQLLIPGVYNLDNTAVPLKGSSYNERRKINSFYGFFQADYKGKVYIGLTGRNDWSSTLPVNHNSYFYPSVNTSILFNEIFALSPKIDLLKLRVGFAQVGNDTDPYQTMTSYYFQGLWGGLPSLAEDGSLKSLQLKPESSNTIELGTEMMFFKNRLGIDITVYKTNSKNQILPLQTANSSGYGSRLVNAGEIANRGLEVMLTTVPVKLSNSFQWNLNVNFARNVSKVVALAPGVDKLVQAAPGEDATIEARVGERMGGLYGPGFQRVKEGDLKGMIIIGANGRPQITADPIYLGNINADWTAGITNRLAYKGFYAEALLDISHGGVFISRFLNKAIGAGQLAESAEGRIARTKGEEYDESKPYYRDGAALMPDGSYKRNLEVFDGTFSKGVYGTAIRDFHKRYYDHNSEAQLLDRSFVKLRELKAGYSFPKRLFHQLPVQSLTLSLVARNLFLWTKNPHFDPETGASTGNGLVGGFENLSIPTSRSIGFNLNVNF